MNEHSMKVAGIDTGKAELHVCILPEDRRFTVANDAAGIAALVGACRAAGVVRCGIESTSIYHRKAAQALRQAGFAVAEPRSRARSRPLPRRCCNGRRAIRSMPR